MATQIPIWAGTSTFSASQTPFGFYDTDASFIADVDNTVTWCAKRLGYPIVDIELQSGSMYAVFEEAITEYSSQVNYFNIKENLLNLQGSQSGSNLTHREITPNFGRTITLAQQYGTEAGVGGDVTYKSGSITVSSASGQTYDLDALWSNVSESGNGIEIKRVFYEPAPAVTRFFDPYVGSGNGTDAMLQGFGWGNYTPAVNFLMLPMYDDLLRVQAIEFNDHMRKSAYTFELVNNQLKVFPIPTDSAKIWFEYIVENDRNNPLKTNSSLITDFSNATYNNMTYTEINHAGKQWIRKYTLALAKELLGSIRSKYGSIPIPGGETNLDGDTLRNEATTEKENLLNQLREDLEATSRRNMLERQKDEAEFMNDTLNRIPYPIYIG
jgi:hypothetical protein|tara:strand:- start:3487 stop:4635 length:1149 start_codon:yes stop_codon:yes gene_type:complete